MLIATRFKRPEAPITIGDKTYHFLPRNPNDPKSEHVCEVENKQHVQRLLGIPEGYYLPDDAPATTTATRPQPTVSTTPNGGAGEGGGDDGDGQDTPTPPSDAVTVQPLDEDQVEAAKNLNALTWQGLKAQITKGGIPAAVLHEALRIEEAKPEEDQRATTLKILKQAIEAG